LHRNNLPNLACQAALAANINPDLAPEEYANYGCAGGLFPMKAAIDYCANAGKAAIVIVFDQCTTRASFCYDPGDPMFRMDLRVNLLFSDGAVGVLVIPESLRSRFSDSLPSVQGFRSAFCLSDMIRFDQSRFILGDQVRAQVPPLVARSVILPLLSEHGMSADEIEEWSLHQGSHDVVDRFSAPDILGLSQVQLERSKATFHEIGNLSAPSSFYVFSSFFKDGGASKRHGMIVGFGAGFYQSALLYQWD
jgi:predicted naringenin-chalcone synthase